jgi:hypothetical protein
VFFLHSAAQRKGHLLVRGSLNLEHLPSLGRSKNRSSENFALHSFERLGEIRNIDRIHRGKLIASLQRSLRPDEWKLV